MNSDQTAGAWKQFTGKVKEIYADLTDDEIGYFNGKKEQLFGAVQQKYGDTREVAEKKFNQIASETKYVYDAEGNKNPNAA